MKLYFILVIAIPLQFLAAFLALRLVRITQKAAWAFIAIAILLMALRRCFTLYEWYAREMVLMPIDIGTEVIGFLTVVLMLLGVSRIAPLFRDIKRSEELLKQRVEERTIQLKDAVEALELELSERQQAEAEKAKLEAQLQQAQKMEAIGRLAGGIAHDFNNILSPIIMYTEIALRDANINPVRPYLEQVLKSSMRASDLVKQILAISRQTEHQRIVLQLSPIVKEVLKLLRASFPATIEIRQHLLSEDDWILADPTEIYQVVMNLCTNAMQALPENGGVIEVSVEKAEIVQQPPESSIVLKPGPYVRLSVRDTGQGMAPEVIKRVFEPYFTTKAVGQGTGLGLAVVQGIVETCGGAINVRSQPGEGTTFKVYFPKATFAEVEEPETPAPLPTGAEYLLLVDDEADIVAAANIMLEQMGYKVQGCTDSREALKTFKASPEAFDLVITDQTMPKLPGAELAKKILQIRPDIPVILCTGYNDAITPEKVKSLGVRELIHKPFVPQKFIGTIRRILDEERRKHKEPDVVRTWSYEIKR